MVDTKDLKSFAFGRAGSSPALGTINFLMDFAFLPLIALAAGLTMWVLTWGVFLLFRRYGIVDKPHLYPHEK